MLDRSEKQDLISSCNKKSAIYVIKSDEKVFSYSIDTSVTPKKKSWKNRAL